MTIRLSGRPALLSIAALALVAALATGLPWLSPQRGVERASRALTAAVENNDREALATRLAADYADEFGLNRDSALATALAFRRHFLICTIRLEQPSLSLDPDRRAAVLRATVRFHGQGDALAQAFIQASASASSPTTFHWRRESWKPWDWKLVSTANPEASRALTRYQCETQSPTY